MNRLRTQGGVAIAVALLAAACGSEPQKTEAPAAPPAPRPKTQEERVARYRECWNYFNASSYEPLRSCYADAVVGEAMGSGRPALKGPDAVVAEDKSFKTAFPDFGGDLQLILAKDDTIVGLAQVNATHSGPLAGPDGKTVAATNKPIGYLMGHVIEWDPMGQAAVAERSYSDSATMLAQIGLNPAPARPALAKKMTAAPVIAVASGAEVERTNAEVYRMQLEAFNKHDLRAVESFNAAGAVFHDLTAPKDTDSKGNTDSLKTMFKAFPDAKLVTTSVWGAGAYTVAEGTFEGTNTGASPAMGIKKATAKAVKVPFIEIVRYEGGKIKDDWVIFQSMAFPQQLGLMK